LTLLVGWQEGHLAFKKQSGGVLELGADLHIAKLMPLPLTLSCFSKIQIGFTFLIPAHLGSLGKRVIKLVCVCVCGTTLSEMPTSVTLLASHHLHPLLSLIVSLSLGILHEQTRTQMLAEPSSNSSVELKTRHNLVEKHLL